MLWCPFCERWWQLLPQSSNWRDLISSLSFPTVSQCCHNILAILLFNHSFHLPTAWDSHRQCELDEWYFHCLIWSGWICWEHLAPVQFVRFPFQLFTGPPHMLYSFLVKSAHCNTRSGHKHLHQPEFSCTGAITRNFITDALSDITDVIVSSTPLNMVPFSSSSLCKQYIFTLSSSRSIGSSSRVRSFQCQHQQTQDSR